MSEEESCCIYVLLHVDMSPQPQNLEPTSSSVQLTPPIFSTVQSFDSLVKGTHLGPGCYNIFGLSIDHCLD